MLRSGLPIAFAVALLCSSTVQADTSAIADYIRTRAYCELSTSNPIGSIEANDIDKASGLIPSIYAGLVVWADGRSGRIAIMGYDLTDPNNIVAPSKGEFLISNETDGWQENNPFAGYSSVGGYRYVGYDAVDVSSPTGGPRQHPRQPGDSCAHVAGAELPSPTNARPHQRHVQPDRSGVDSPARHGVGS